jgi:hypothetical protein
VSKRDPKEKKEIDGSKWWSPKKSLVNLGNFWLIIKRCNKKYHSMHIVDQSNRKKGTYKTKSKNNNYLIV